MVLRHLRAGVGGGALVIDLDWREGPDAMDGQAHRLDLLGSASNNGPEVTKSPTLHLTS